MRNLILMLAMFLCSKAYSQSSQQAALDTLENRYQQCLGNSHNMYSCAVTYYKQLDSLLNHTLEQLYSSANSSALQKLQAEQQAWEAKKEEYFKKIDERVEKMHKRTMDGLDDDMISTDNKAAFLKERLTTLLNI